MIIITKIIAILLALMVISKTFSDYKKHRESLTMFLFWTLAWLFIAYVALRPTIFYTFVTKMSDEHIGSGTFVGIAFIFLFFITYRVYIKANRLEQQIRDIVMKIGIKDIDDKN
ncbi:MAG: DUF2304 domain-containing protein [Candidatus Berkelbacteria bacterium]